MPLQAADDHACCHDLVRAMHFDASPLHPDKVTTLLQAADDHQVLPLIESKYAVADIKPCLTGDGQYLMSLGDVRNRCVQGLEQPTALHPMFAY
jgi:hypothetical protein